MTRSKYVNDKIRQEQDQAKRDSVTSFSAVLFDCPATRSRGRDSFAVKEGWSFCCYEQHCYVVVVSLLSSSFCCLCLEDRAGNCALEKATLFAADLPRVPVVEKMSRIIFQEKK